ncbi:DUF262 domain-containing protein [Sinorhizobium meliloti]|uniref:DUF262 domain-containing protein n=1 Tax=Rhizobium meliloti TaxID=382 RepID=UPI001294FDA2|nr:DUF262 domain-containing protein [Sinorhizobium meliloti]MQW64874.1 DUF262 domain-containing protein [Sinorhizobium meliloti]
MKTAPESRKVAAILRSLRDGTLQPQPEFQRRAVWTNKDKIAFIQTLLMGYPFPEIYVASGDVNTKTGDAVELLVDGQQRVRTIDEYFRAAPPFARSAAVPRYSALGEDEKREFLNYDVSVRNLGIVELEQIRVIFQRMNATSYDLNEMERHNAVYLGAYKQFSERLAQHDFFIEHRIFSAADIRRMKDVSFVASLTSTMMSDYFHRDEQIEEYLERYNEEFPESGELESRYYVVFSLMNEMGFDPRSRAWKKADFYTLFVELDRVANRQGKRIDVPTVAARLKGFFEEIDRLREGDPTPDEAVGDYFRATLQSTNDRGARHIRGEILRDLITR